MAISPVRAIKLAQAYTAAWNTHSPEAVAAFFAETGAIVINKGEPWKGRDGVARMAAGFFADVQGLTLECDSVRAAEDHVVYMWTFTGTHTGTKNRLSISGWEEWDLDDENKIVASRGWYDAEDYARQVVGS